MECGIPDPAVADLQGLSFLRLFHFLSKPDLGLLINILHVTLATSPLQYSLSYVLFQVEFLRFLQVLIVLLLLQQGLLLLLLSCAGDPGRLLEAGVAQG